MRQNVFKRLISLTLTILLIFPAVGTTPNVFAATGYITEICESAKNSSVVTISSVSVSDGNATLEGVVKDGSDSVAIKIYDCNGTLRWIDQPMRRVDDTYTTVFAIDDEALGLFTVEMYPRNGSKVTYTFGVYYNDAYTELEKQLAEVYSLIKQCENKGLSPEYEKLLYNCAVRAVDVMRQLEARTDDNTNDTLIIDYNTTFVTESATELKTKLQSYINGTAKPVGASITDNLPLSTYGKTFLNSSGQPVFLNGYCDGWENRDDTGSYKSFGVNTVAQVITFKDIVGEALAPAGWATNGGSAGMSDADMLTDGNNVYDGERSLSIVNRTAATANVTKYIYQYVDLQPNTTYVLSAYVKGRANNLILNVGSGTNKGRIEGAVNSSSWTYKSVEFTTDSTGLSNALAYVGSNDTATGVYVDDLKLIKKGATSNMIVNGDFENYYKADSGDVFGVSQMNLDNYKQRLSDIRDNGLYVIVSPAFHDVDSFKFLISQDGVKGSDEEYSVYMKLNPTHPVFFDAADTYVDAVMPIVAEFDNVVGFQIANEPRFNAYAHAYYVPQWRQFLKDKYGTISKLNTVYGSSYAGFDSVAMPSSASKTTLYYDYVTFNESIMAQFHSHISARIKSVSKEIPVFTKAMIATSSQVEPAVMTYGINYENKQLSDSFDYNGNDSWAYIDNAYNTMQAMLMWYDTQTSVKNKPVLNLENHYILDKSTVVFDERTPDWIRTSLWQGAIHGKGANLTWLWGISDSTNTAFRNSCVQYRGDVMYQSGKTTYDLNRLANEISALQNKTCDVAILHSHSTSIYNYQHENSLYKTYTSLLYKGFKPFIANEYDISQINNYDILIVPEVTHISDEAVEAIVSYIKNGGKVYLFGADCFTYDCNGVSRAASASAIAGLTAAKTYTTTRTVTSKKSSISSSIPSYVAEIVGDADLTVTNTGTQAAADGVEITYVYQGNSLLVNMCNYNSSSVTVEPQLDGYRIIGGTELISGDEVGDTVTLNTYEPVLIRYDIRKGEFSLVDDNGNVTSQDIHTLTAGNIQYTVTADEIACQENLMMIMAHFGNNGKTLKETALVQGAGQMTATIKISEAAEGDVLRVYIWGKDKLNPITQPIELYKGGN